MYDCMHCNQCCEIVYILILTLFLFSKQTVRLFLFSLVFDMMMIMIW